MRYEFFGMREHALQTQEEVHLLIFLENFAASREEGFSCKGFLGGVNLGIVGLDREGIGVEAGFGEIPFQTGRRALLEVLTLVGDGIKKEHKVELGLRLAHMQGLTQRKQCGQHLSFRETNFFRLGSDLSLNDNRRATLRMTDRALAINQWRLEALGIPDVLHTKRNDGPGEREPGGRSGDSRVELEGHGGPMRKGVKAGREKGEKDEAEFGGLSRRREGSERQKAGRQ